MVSKIKSSLYFTVVLLFIVVILAGCTNNALSGQAAGTKRSVPVEKSVCTQPNGASGLTVWSYVPGDNTNIPPPVNTQGASRVGCCQKNDCISVAGACFGFDQVHGTQWICGKGNDWDRCGAAGDSRSNKLPGDRSEGENYICEQVGSIHRWSARPSSRAVREEPQVSPSSPSESSPTAGTGGPVCDTSTDNLIAWWQAENNVNDIINNNNGIPIANRIPTEIIYNAGRYGQSFELQEGQRIEVSDTSILHLVEGFTIMAWINTDVGNGEIINKDPNYRLIISGDKPQFDIYTSTSAQLGLRPTYDYGAPGGGHNIPNNEWTHLAASIDNDHQNMRLYINGREAGVMTFTTRQTIAETINPLKIGGGVFEGKIDNVMIFNRQLSEEEIEDAMNIGC